MAAPRRKPVAASKRPTRRTASTAKPAAKRPVRRAAAPAVERTQKSAAQPVRKAAPGKKRPGGPGRKPMALTDYATKPPTDYHKALAKWIVSEVGYNPNEAASKREAFLFGVAIATAARSKFMDSDFLAEWREKSGTEKPGPKAEVVKPVSKRRKPEPEPVEDDDDFEDEDEDFDDEEVEDEFDDESDDSDEDEDDEFDDEDEESDEDDEDEDEDEFDDDEDEEEEEPEPAPKRRPASGSTAKASPKRATKSARGSRGAPVAKASRRTAKVVDDASDDLF